MRSISPERNLSLTRRTMYASLCKVKPPNELDTTTSANNKVAEKTLDKNRKALNNIHRKSISQMNSQRKLLEKSMMAYSEKMKEISSERTSDLFREIHTRNSMKPTRGTKSLTLSVVSTDNEDMSLASERRNISKLRTSLGDIYKTETKAVGQRKLSMDEVRFTHLRRLLRRSSTIDQIALSPLREESTMSTTPSGVSNFGSGSKTERCSVVPSPNDVRTPDKCDNISNKGDECTTAILTVPRIHVSKAMKTSQKSEEQTRDTTLDRLDIKTREDEGNDSAYNSCCEEDIDISGDNDLSREVVPLTVPKMHVRRNNVRKMAALKNDSLHENVVVINVTECV